MTLKRAVIEVTNTMMAPVSLPHGISLMGPVSLDSIGVVIANIKFHSTPLRYCLLRLHTRIHLPEG